MVIPSYTEEKDIGHSRLVKTTHTKTMKQIVQSSFLISYMVELLLGLTNYLMAAIEEICLTHSNVLISTETLLRKLSVRLLDGLTGLRELRNNLIKKVTMINKTVKCAITSTRRYLGVFLPISLMILSAIFQWGDELGEFLIQRFGVVYGLYMRPIVIALFPIVILAILSLPNFEKLNQLIWFSKFTKDQINYISKSYIYSVGSFASLSLVVVLMTLFAYSENGINWQNSKDYLVLYLVFVLVVTPMFHVFNLRRAPQKG